MIYVMPLFFCANISYLKYKSFFSKKKGSKKMKHIKKILIPAAIVGGITIVIAKLCKKDSADHIDLTLNDDDIDEVEKEMAKEMEKNIEVMPEISEEDETEIWDFGDL